MNEKFTCWVTLFYTVEIFFLFYTTNQSHRRSREPFGIKVKIRFSKLSVDTNERIQLVAIKLCIKPFFGCNLIDLSFDLGCSEIP